MSQQPNPKNSEPGAKSRTSEKAAKGKKAAQAKGDGSAEVEAKALRAKTALILAETEQTQAEVEKSKADARLERVRVEAELTRTRAEAEIARAQADKAEAEAARAKAERTKAKAEANATRAKTKAELASAEARKVESIVVSRDDTVLADGRIIQHRSNLQFLAGDRWNLTRFLIGVWGSPAVMVLLLRQAPDQGATLMQFASTAASTVAATAAFAMWAVLRDRRKDERRLGEVEDER